MEFLQVNSNLFHKMLIAACSKLGPKKEYITVHDITYYDKCICYLSSNCMVGFAVNNDNELISLFNIDIERGILKNIIAFLKSNYHYLKLDCFEPLNNYYSKFGFVTYKKELFNDFYASNSWDYNTLGRPAVHYMEINL